MSGGISVFKGYCVQWSAEKLGWLYQWNSKCAAQSSNAWVYSKCNRLPLPSDLISHRKVNFHTNSQHNLANKYIIYTWMMANRVFVYYRRLQVCQIMAYFLIHDGTMHSANRRSLYNASHDNTIVSRVQLICSNYTRMSSNICLCVGNVNEINARTGKSHMFNGSRIFRDTTLHIYTFKNFLEMSDEFFVEICLK